MVDAFDFKKLFLTRGQNEPILNLPWGSLFILHVVNNLVKERPHLDKVMPFWPLNVPVVTRFGGGETCVSCRWPLTLWHLRRALRTVAVAVDWLLLVSGSASVAATEAVFVASPVAPAVTMIVAVAVAPSPRVPRSQVTAAVPEHEP